MKACKITPKHQIMDNEASAAYIASIQQSDMTYEKVPPDDHRRNIAEKAIQTWKDHFVLVLSGTSETFPLHLWCQLLPQMERQLNLLGNSNTIPHISTYTHLYGHHNYNAKPFIPIGMEALTHDKPHHRKTFAQHCSKGWVLGMSPEHYRCWTIWSKDTRATRVTGRVLSKHKYLTNPHVTPEDQVMAAAANLATVLTTNKTQTKSHIRNIRISSAYSKSCTRRQRSKSEPG